MSAKLKMTVQTVYRVNYNDFTNYVQEVYGNPFYEFAADEEASNYSSYEYDVDARMDEYDESQLEKFMNHENMSMPATILLNALAARNLIPRGHYVINVFW